MIDERPIFLVGFMGSGKSTLVRLLAGRLGRVHLDTDAEVERIAGRSVEQIFAGSGEAEFRRLEREVLEQSNARGAGVVACGGGLFVARKSRVFMQKRGVSVWLDVPLEECRRRLGAGPGRPLWDAADPLAQRALFERRRSLYALARIRVAGAAEPASETADRVLRRLRSVFP